MIIVEIGLNHLGSDKILSEFLKIPDNVDAVTIQIISDDFYNNPDYKSLKLSDAKLINFIGKLLNLGKKVGLAIDDYTKINKFLPNEISFYKILSKDIENKKLIDAVKNTDVESIYISTGMSDYCLLDSVIPALVKSDKRIKLIHTQLSNNIADVNIKAIQVMRDRYQTPVAYGHHCDVPNVIYASLGLLPESIFFYIKGSEDLEYPDNAHAIDLLNVEELVYGIKNIKKAIGNGEKISMKNWK
jgi:sialic acid synthase SpsE